MKHRHLINEDWSKQAIDSLFERGARADWEEFSKVLRTDKLLAERTLAVCEYHQNIESATLAKVLVNHFFQQIK